MLFDFIFVFIFGELVGNVVYDKGVRIVEIIFVFLLWGILIYFIELIM